MRIFAILRRHWGKLSLVGIAVALAVGRVAEVHEDKTFYVDDPSIATTAYLAAGGFAFLGLVRVLYMRSLPFALAREMEWMDLRSLKTFSREFAPYRFVDLWNAVEAYCRRFENVAVLDVQQHQSLENIIRTREFLPLRPAPMFLQTTDYHEEHFFPQERFYLIRPSNPGGAEYAAVLRCRWMHSQVWLEIAARDIEMVENAFAWIVRWSTEHSIYRNRVIEVDFGSQVANEYGDYETSPVQLIFKQKEQITRDDLIVDDQAMQILDRNVFQFHRIRERLKQYGVPCRKGLLFYGPPGTGKTYTCRYIAGNLDGVTTLLVTGHALTQVKSVCNLARMLQPSLLILEDVDLIFAAREINLYSTALGEMMDELDGFQIDDAIMILMTTNAIDRLERAIKDRPGRINQCIHFGLPNPGLREKFLRQYLTEYDCGELDVDHVVSATRGASQAFLKELVFRAVQYALENEVECENGSRVRLQNGDFDVALAEMTRYEERSTRAIMGFQVDHS